MSEYTSYQPRDWNNGEIVYADDLDHIENGIKNLEQYLNNIYLIKCNNYFIFNESIQNTSEKKWEYLWDNLLSKIPLGSSVPVLLAENIVNFLSGGKITNTILLTLINRAGTEQSLNFRIHSSSTTGASQYCWKINRAISNNEVTYTIGPVYRYSGTEI